MVHYYNNCVSGHHQLSCFLFKTRRFEDLILSPSSGQIYSVGPIQSPKRCVSNKKQDSVLNKNRTMDNVQTQWAF
jgi:hypothetical protein